jgi:lysozyme
VLYHGCVLGAVLAFHFRHLKAMSVLASLLVCSSALTACMSADSRGISLADAAPQTVPAGPTPPADVMAAAPAQPVSAAPVAMSAMAAAEVQQPAAQAAPLVALAAEKTDGATTGSIPSQAPKPAVLHPRFGDYDRFDFPNRQPTDYAVHGTDTSRWQPEINWSKVRGSGISFAFIKATEGGDHIDKSFKENWAKAKKARVPRGAYHFYYFCTAPEVQARWYLKNVPNDPHAMPPALDAEWNHQSRTCPGKPDPAKVRRDLHTWLKIVEKATGKRPVIYTTPDFYDDNDMGRFEGYHFWLRSTAAHPSERYPHEKWTFWQYTGTGKIPGIEGKADINAFRGSAADWQKWLKANGVKG